MMFSIPGAIRHVLTLGRPGPMGFGGARLRRDIGMDDWEGSIGTADPDQLWPLPRGTSRARRPAGPRDPDGRQVGAVAGPCPGPSQA